MAFSPPAPLQGRVYALPDVWIRPAFGGKGRKVTGTLEAHANGFRYTSPKGEELDIMYRCVWVCGGGGGGEGGPGRVRSPRPLGAPAGPAAGPGLRVVQHAARRQAPPALRLRRNVKHAFFQPADNEMIALVHFHLVNPIMVGKKKTNDVQVRGRPPAVAPQAAMLPSSWGTRTYRSCKPLLLHTRFAAVLALTPCDVPGPDRAPVDGPPVPAPPRRSSTPR